MFSSSARERAIKADTMLAQAHQPISRHYRTIAIGFGTFVLASRVRAQNPVQPVFTDCVTASTWTASERQVTFPARFIGDTTVSPQPQPRQVTSRDVVEFIVDTLGVPSPETFRVVMQSDSLLVERAHAQVRRWRFTPAVASGCKVRQRVTVALRW